MSEIINRYNAVLRDVQCDRQTAATLTLAEQINVLVTLLANVDATVTKIDQAAIRNTPTDIPAEAKRYIQDTYLT
jgi:hypothetical protein